jgi:hypothetical protein
MTANNPMLATPSTPQDPSTSPQRHRRRAIPEPAIDVLYAAPQAHGIVNVALNREYSLGIVFIFS